MITHNLDMYIKQTVQTITLEQKKINNTRLSNINTKHHFKSKNKTSLN